MKWLCRISVFIASVAIVAVVFIVTDQSPVMDYGSPEKSYIMPSEVSPGENALICLDDVTWLRLCPSTLKWWLYDQDGRRHDYKETISVHHIFPPAKAQKLPPKCRAWKVPAGLSPGQKTMTGLVESRCPPIGEWSPIRIDFPKIKFTVKGPS